jgi:CRP/FNR family cyclic AMP-dependent transcriptional regulator
MIERFAGKREVLIDSLKEQKLVRGSEALAARIADVGELVEAKPGVAIMSQGGAGDDVYLILAGSFDIIVNGRSIARRVAGEHVGEMAVTQPSQACTSTVTASELSVVSRITNAQFLELAAANPDVWRNIARELAKRLEERNALVPKARDKTRLFVISSTESLAVARAIQNAFEHDPFHVTVWTDGVFLASRYPVESLEEQLDQSDFAIAIASPDDVVESRGKSAGTARDNVVFEIGLFIGRLGRKRSLLLEPRGEAVKLPSDLSGITTISYRHGAAADLEAGIGPAVNRMRDIIKELGPKN